MASETVSQQVERLQRAFRTPDKRISVIAEIIAIPPIRMAIVSVRIYQNLSPDQYLEAIYCRMLEALTYTREAEDQSHELGCLCDTCQGM